MDINIIGKFQSPIGKIICGLESSSDNFTHITNNKYENGISKVIEIEGFNIEIIEFKLKHTLHNEDFIANSNGWIWRINKTNNSLVKLKIFCLLTEYNDDVFFDIASGENLDAIEASNETWKLHIGTEDGEIMSHRAKNNDWFPESIKEQVSFYQSITEIHKNGFYTKIPELQMGEKIHIHYLTAFDKKNTQSINTWLAVDADKRRLENWVGIF